MENVPIGVAKEKPKIYVMQLYLIDLVLYSRRVIIFTVGVLIK